MHWGDLIYEKKRFLWQFLEFKFDPRHKEKTYLGTNEIFEASALAYVILLVNFLSTPGSSSCPLFMSIKLKGACPKKKIAGAGSASEERYFGP